MAFRVNHVGGNGSGWTTVEGDAWKTVDCPGVGASLIIHQGGKILAEFAPGKWSAICDADNPASPSLPPRTPPVGSSGVTPPRRGR